MRYSLTVPSAIQNLNRAYSAILDTSNSRVSLKVKHSHTWRAWALPLCSWLHYLPISPSRLQVSFLCARYVIFNPIDCPSECGPTMCASDRSCSSLPSQCTDSYSFLTPDLDCTQFACPRAFYRHAIEKSCRQCDESCSTCSGPTPRDCLTCPSGSFLSLTNSSEKHGQCFTQENET